MRPGDYISDVRTRDDVGDGRLRLEIDEGVEAARLHDALVLLTHVPATVWSVGARLDLQGRD
jgi:hypothetical protein